MPRRGRRIGSGVTALQEPSEALSSDPARMIPERSIVREPDRTTATVSPSESAIATVAYQLWLDKGCPVGSDQEDWFRAEAMLKNALVAMREDLSRHPSISRRDTRTESDMPAESTWEGHWEVWEMEWSAPRWVRDRPSRPSRV